MGITVVKGNISHLNDCEEAIVNSELGRRYFSQTGSARSPEAKRLYESIGYTAIGDIPDLYRKGITECLMMKSKEAM